MDWKNLGFGYHPTRAWVRAEYRNGAWGKPQVVTDPYFKIHSAAIALQYGQSCFEGLKAFQTKDEQTVLFRPDQNAHRMQRSADRICMIAPPTELFVECCKLAVFHNREFVPPYGTGASLYLRPTLIGVDPAIGLAPSQGFDFYVLVTPVGPYYKDGFSPVKALVVDHMDRAAALGTGTTKVAGNYAAGLLPSLYAKKQGYPIALHTDPVKHEYIDEFGTSNFLGITKSGEYQTPDSSSILPSITNDSLMQLAKDMGLKVVKRPIPIAELDQFVEVGACGTAAVITPIYSITRKDKVWTFGAADKAGETLTKLYKALQGIQYGEEADVHGWLVNV